MEKTETPALDLIATNFGTVKKQAYDLAVLPWGATEPHNYHLPYMTDCILSHDVAVDAARLAYERAGVRCMVRAPVPFGTQNPGQKRLPFCVHTRLTTQEAILRDIVSSLYVQGIRRLAIVNGHGGNNFKGMIRDLAFDYPDFLITCSDWFAIIPTAGYFDERIDDHAGEQETSVMMHYHPELVDLSMAGSGMSHPFAVDSLNRKVAWTPRRWDKSSDDTGIGDPRKSTAEKGARYAAAVADALATLFVELTTQPLYDR